MFNKLSGTKRSSGTDTIIGQATRFEGNIFCETNLHVEGQINGDIYCSGDIFVSESGKLTSQIQANNLTLSGQLEGNVIVKGSCTIESKGKLTGEVESAVLIIQEGGIFNGTSRMNSSSSSSDNPKLIAPITEAAASSE